MFLMAEKVESQSAKPSCAFYLAAKRRNCKMLVVQGSKYCGQHIAMVSNLVSTLFVCCDIIHVTCKIYSYVTCKIYFVSYF